MDFKWFYLKMSSGFSNPLEKARVKVYRGWGGEK